jgi:hypothetical protein
MKKTIPLLLMACGSLHLCLASYNSSRWTIREEETIQKTLALTGEPQRVVIDNIDGFVHVTGTSGSQVIVSAHKIIRAETDADTQQAKKEVSLQFTEQPGSVSIYYDAPWRHNDHRRFYSVTYDIDVQVPRNARLVVDAVNGGEVRVAGTSGDFDIKNVNGGIHMTDVSGSGDVHTVNGPVTASFRSNPQRPCSFKSVNGKLEAYFQPGLSADLQLKTFNGGIYADFDITAGATPTGEAERHDGKYVYRSSKAHSARVGQGGPQLSFDTLNGSIRLHETTQGTTQNDSNN